MNADLETQIIELNNNPAFCALREKFAQDTIFDILGATNRELVNSRFFAWLLSTPTASTTSAQKVWKSCWSASI